MKKIIALLLAIGLGQMAPVMAMKGDNSPSSFSSGNYFFNPSSPVHSSGLKDDSLQDDLRFQQGQSSNGNEFGFRGGFSHGQGGGLGSDIEEDDVVEDEVVERRTYRGVLCGEFSRTYENVESVLIQLARMKSNSDAIAEFLNTESAEQDNAESILRKFKEQFCETIKSDYELDKQFLKFDCISKLNDEELQGYSVKTMVEEQIKKLFTHCFSYLTREFEYLLFQDFEVTSEIIKKIVDDRDAYFVSLIAKKKNELTQKSNLGSEELLQLNQYSQFLVHYRKKDLFLGSSCTNASSSTNNNSSLGFASLGVAAVSLTKDVMASYNKEVKKLLIEKQQRAEEDGKFKGKRVTLTRSEKVRCALAMLQKHTNPKNIKANKMFWAAAVVAFGSLMYNKASSFKMPEFSMPRFGGQGEREYTSAGSNYGVGSERDRGGHDDLRDQSSNLHSDHDHQRDSEFLHAD